MANGNVELKNQSLVHAAARDGMRMLEELAREKRKHGFAASVPMSEYVKLILWECQENKRLADEEIEKDRREGWKIESRTWCGVPLADFEIPSLGIYAQRKRR